MTVRRWMVTGAVMALAATSMIGTGAVAAPSGLAAPAAAAGPDEGVGVSGTDLGPDKIGRSKNMKHLANLPTAGPLAGGTGTDIAFADDKAFVGNYNGFQIFDISKPARPKLLTQVLCPGSQNDVTVSGDFLYLSTDSSRSDDSCTSVSQPATEKSSWEGIKIFDISDLKSPKYIKSVETKCGSHTHTLIPGKKFDYLYVSSYAPNETFPDCKPPHDLISIVKVDKKTPNKSKVIATPKLFPNGGNPGGPDYSATTGCHDITVLPSKGIAAGACMGDGIIMDIRNPEKPFVLDRVTDTENFAFWHSATFNVENNKVIFTDELGGGGAATCNEDIGPTRGANGIYDLSKRGKLTFRSYYKIPRHQNDTENCVAHNGSVIPVANRDIMVQSWYMGGTSVWDFTDADHPRELAYFERGPAAGADGGGTWSSYYYNGYIYSSDLGKGFDVLKFSSPITQKIDKVDFGQLNVQTQPAYQAR